MEATQLIKILREEIETRTRQVESLKQALASLERDAGNLIPSIMAEAETTAAEITAQRPAAAGDFDGLAVGQAARIYLQQLGRPALLADIRKFLLDVGVDMGKYPKRTIKLSVKNSPQFFELTGDAVNPLVSLRKP